MSAQRVLIDTARATVYGLRALADSLELALDRLDSEASDLNLLCLIPLDLLGL